MTTTHMLELTEEELLTLWSLLSVMAALGKLDINEPHERAVYRKVCELVEQ